MVAIPSDERIPGDPTLGPPRASPVGDSQKDEAVPTGVATLVECSEACAGGRREPPSKFRDAKNDLAIVAGVGDEQEYPRNPEIALLGSDASFEGLDIVDTGLGLDHRNEAIANDDSVRAPQVALDRYRHFRAELQGRRQSPSKSIEECQVGRIAYWIAVGMKGGRELEAQNCAIFAASSMVSRPGSPRSARPMVLCEMRRCRPSSRWLKPALRRAMVNSEAVRLTR